MVVVGPQLCLIVFAVSSMLNWRISFVLQQLSNPSGKVLLRKQWSSWRMDMDLLAVFPVHRTSIFFAKQQDKLDHIIVSARWRGVWS